MKENNTNNVDLTASTSIPRLGIRAEEAAKLLGISPRHLWSKTNCGEIPHLRIGKSIIYPLEMLNEYLAKNTKGGI